MDVPTQAELIERIEAFCARHDMAESRFGREAVNNPAFVSGLRDRGRSPTLETLNRLSIFMAERDAALAPGVQTEADSHRPFPATTAGLTATPSVSRCASSPTCSPTNDRQPSSGASLNCSSGTPDEGCSSARPTANPAPQADAA